MFNFTAKRVYENKKIPCNSNYKKLELVKNV